MIYQCRIVFDLWNSWKNLLPRDRKVRRKNQIPKYYAPSPEGSMRTIRERSIDEKPLNPVRYWGGNPKDLWDIIGEKPPNLVEY